MRELKFRAWDGEDMYIPEIQENEQGENINDWFASFRNVTLMQYTGLKDKNGKEIYEGDVVTWVERGMKNCKAVGQVSWDKDGWNVQDFYNGSQDEPGRAFSENAEVEIIGNIWENPELIK